MRSAVKYNKISIVEILIEISKEQKDGNVFLKLEFVNNGIGISNNMKKLIYQKGYKKERHTKGMGFGLSLVKKIKKSYKGQIWVEDKVKRDYAKGSNFVIFILKVQN